MVRISASILGFFFDAHIRNVPESVMIKNINDALATKSKEFHILHLDIEDGKFVSQKSFTPAQIRKIKCKQKKEVHLMVVNYKKYIKDYYLLADMFIIHQEVIRSDFLKTIEFLRKNKKYIGIAISPNTPLEEIKHLDKIDLVLIMSVYPGLSGQTFIDTALRKIRKLAEYRKKNKLKFVIEVDGGIHEGNQRACITAGADILVKGTSFFR